MATKKYPMLQKVKRFRMGLLIGLSIVGIFIAVIQTGNWQYNMAPGSMNTGHESLACEECHLESKGTFRQQLQANIQYWLGKRKATVTIGYNPVSNRDCVDCHRRPKDRHPVYRFMEPKYKKIRQEIQAHSCNACHQEHSGTRVTIEAEFCSHCHEKLKLKKDPLDTTHQQLVKEKRWSTCLGCHDFHGNYQYEVPEKVNQAKSGEVINDYLLGGQSPYGKDKQYKAKETRHENQL